MPTLEENVNRVKAAKTAIGAAITAKGGTVGVNDGLEDFASDIATIPSGGGVTFYSVTDINNKLSTNNLSLYNYNGKTYLIGTFVTAGSLNEITVSYPNEFTPQGTTANTQLSATCERGSYSMANGTFDTTNKTIKFWRGITYTSRTMSMMLIFE